VVNVILVDFRGVDTLGEIVVLAIAMLGAVVLFANRMRRRGGSGRSPKAARALVPRGMRSLIMQKVALAALPVTLLFAVYLLLRGHNEPGGGFIAGLVTASAIVLQALAFGVEARGSGSPRSSAPPSRSGW
jgi:multicomponent K+:H+ antiporter subunit A